MMMMKSVAGCCSCWRWIGITIAFRGRWPMYSQATRGEESDPPSSIIRWEDCMIMEVGALDWLFANKRCQISTVWSVFDRPNAEGLLSKAQKENSQSSGFSSLHTNTLQASHERENEYAMKAIMRTLITADRDILPVFRVSLERLTNLVESIAKKNPRNPDFNHCLFDAIACIVRTACAVDGDAVGTVESLSSTPFMQLLKDQVTEFTPDVFLILAQILEFRPAGLGENLQVLVQPLLSAELWSQQCNVPALTRLMKAYIGKSPSDLSAHVVPLLGIFQKLMSKSATENQCPIAMASCLNEFPSRSVSTVRDLFQVILNTIQGTPSSKPSRPPITWTACRALWWTISCPLSPPFIPFTSLCFARLVDKSTWSESPSRSRQRARNTSDQALCRPRPYWQYFVHFLVDKGGCDRRPKRTKRLRRVGGE
jgi:CAS/CSE protein, C-terminus